MDKLRENMSTITEFSEKITGTLQGKRQQITKLSGVHTLLKKVNLCQLLMFILLKNFEVQSNVNSFC